MERAVGREWYASIDPKAEPPGGPQPEAVALPLFRQAVEGLRFMHQTGVAHLDIKLENIMIKDDGTLIFIDFGLASTSEVQEAVRQHQRSHRLKESIEKSKKKSH